MLVYKRLRFSLEDLEGTVGFHSAPTSLFDMLLYNSVAVIDRTERKSVSL